MYKQDKKENKDSDPDNSMILIKMGVGGSKGPETHIYGDGR